MLSKELLAQVEALDEDDKLKLLQTLIDDPALAKVAYDPFGLRGNYEAAQKLLDLLEKQKVSTQPEVE